MRLQWEEARIKGKGIKEKGIKGKEIKEVNEMRENEGGVGYA